MGKADYYAHGDWNAVCYECGRKMKASMLRRHWQGYWVCPEHWEARHPQDFVRGVVDNMAPPWTQPAPAPIFVAVGTLAGKSAVVGVAITGISIVGTNTNIGT